MRLRVASGAPMVGGLIGGISTVPFYGAVFGAYIVLPLEGEFPIHDRSVDLISDGPETLTGDRSCRHVRFIGDAICISDETCKVYQAQVQIGPGTPPPTTLQTLRDWYRPDGSAQSLKVLGPVWSKGDSGSWFREFPDYDGRRFLQTELWIRATIDGSIVTLERHERNFRKPSGPAVETLFVNVYEIDFVNLRYRQIEPTVSGWYSFTAIRSSAPSKIPSLPKTWNDYVYYSNILKRFGDRREADVFGDLVRRCANDAQVIQTNSLELVRDLRRLSDELRSLYGLVRGKKTIKTLSDAYLSYKYGLRLTGQDINLIISTANRELSAEYREISRSRSAEERFFSDSQGNEEPLHAKYVYKVSYRPYDNDWRRFCQLWMDSGLFPSLQNLWDLVPLSFVVDWFVPVNKYLNSTDAQTYWSVHSVLGCTYSQKLTVSDSLWMFLSRGYNLVGSLSFVDYTRTTSETLHKPLFFDPSPRYFKNYAELTALIVSNTKHRAPSV